MSRDYNKVILLGRLARDPDIKTLENGSKTARFTLASGKEWKDKATGEKKEQVDFNPCTAWNFTAEILEKYCKKGSRILAEGRLHSYSYEKDGAKKYVTEAVIDSILLLDTKKDSGGEYAGGGDGIGGHAQDPYAGSAGEPFPEDFLDFSGGSSNADVEIPF